jgi:hypothetical protein
MNFHNVLKSKSVASLFLLATLLVGSAFAQGVKKKIRFAGGDSSATVKGAVIRGERDRYYLGAKKGQTMSVKITSEEDNAVFQVYRPGEAETLSGAGEGDDAKDWSGELPGDGEYVIVVGGTRGNASYTLTVSIE